MSNWGTVVRDVQVLNIVVAVMTPDKSIRGTDVKETHCWNIEVALAEAWVSANLGATCKDWQ